MAGAKELARQREQQDVEGGSEVLGQMRLGDQQPLADEIVHKPLRKSIRLAQRSFRRQGF